MNTNVIVGSALTILCCGTLLAETPPPAEQPMAPSEAAVRKVVQQHIDGIVHADIKLLESAWDTKTGTISYVEHDKSGKQFVQSGPITDSFKLWTAPQKGRAKGTIQSVDVVDNKMAMVKAQITWNQMVFDDVLVLLKTDGGWKLVSKTYTSQRPSLGPYGGLQ